MASGTVDLYECMTWFKDLIGFSTNGDETNQNVMIDMEEIWFELPFFCYIIDNHVEDTR